MSIHMFGYCGITTLFCLQRTIINISISDPCSISKSRTNGSCGLRRPFVFRPISASVSQKISLNPPGRTMEVVDLQRKIPLPEVFLTFLKENGIDPAVYDAARELPRYIRYKIQTLSHAKENFEVNVVENVCGLTDEATEVQQSTSIAGEIGRKADWNNNINEYANLYQYGKTLKQTLQSSFSEIEEELGLKLSPLSWLPGFYSIPPEIKIAGTKAYQEGKIYGMDAASGAAVEALDICPGDHVLDLCAAPGAKLCMMTDLLTGPGTLTATDISPSRLAVSRTMLLKYGLGSRCRLFLADGSTFSLLPLKDGAKNSVIHEAATKSDIKVLPKQSDCHENYTGSIYVESNVYGEWKSRKTAKEKKAAKRLKYLEDGHDRVGGRESELLYYGKSSGVVGMKVADVFGNSCSGDALDNGYDKVLVDAECTHDGSLKHIYKYEQWGWDTFEQRFFNSERMSSLTSLQLSLLSNGFRLLKVGGTLVYSTCSFTVAQNEDVVKNFLAFHRNAGKYRYIDQGTPTLVAIACATWSRDSFGIRLNVDSLCDAYMFDCSDFDEMNVVHCIEVRRA